MPDRQFTKGLESKLNDFDASLIYEVIEINRRDPMLEKAVRYFSGDKVVTKTFDTAAKLQMKGVKEIITEDGTVFKPGTISGGNQANIFNLNLGTVQLDANISKIVDKI